MSSERFVGIDVAKAHLDVAWNDAPAVTRVANDAPALEALVRDLRAGGAALVVCEATGGYHAALLAALLAAGVPAVAVNPRQARDFARACGLLEKTDAVDARALAQFAARVRPPVRATAPDAPDAAFGELVARRRQLVEMLVAERNRLEHASSKAVVRDVRAHIDWLKKRLRDVDKDLDCAVQAHPRWDARLELLESVPGVGRVTALTLLSALPELGTVDRKAIAKLAGVAPLSDDSGRRTGKRRIWGGRAEVRAVLYMATLVATRHNAPIREAYAALKARGKEKKVALVACMHKLLTILNAIARTSTPWQPQRAA